MATYSSIIRQVALRCGMLRGPQVESLQTSYSTDPLTVAEFAILKEAPNTPLYALVDYALNAEAGLVDAIASTANHPFRASITEQTANLAYGALIPATSSGGGAIVSQIYGAVRDAVTSEPMTENQLEQIRDRVQNPDDTWLIQQYWYAIFDRRIYHTVANVVMDVCVYDRPAMTVSLSDSIALPDVLVPAYVDGALASIDPQYGKVYSEWIGAIRGGAKSINSAATIVQSEMKAA